MGPKPTANAQMPIAAPRSASLVARCMSDWESESAPAAAAPTTSSGSRATRKPGAQREDDERDPEQGIETP